MHSLDDYDKQILRLVQQNNLLTAEELAESVSLSASSVQRRLRRLRKDRIIEADVSIVAAAVAHIGLTCIVDVALKEGNPDELEIFKRSLRKCPEVMQSYYVTGTYDFVLVITAMDIHDYEKLSKRILVDNQNVKHFYTHVVMDKVKQSYGIQI